MINCYSDYDSSSVYSDESGLEISTNTTLPTQITDITPPKLRAQSDTNSDRIDSYRFSMANLEETHEAELDAILGELSLLEQRSVNKDGVELRQTRRGSHSRSNSTISGLTNSTISTVSSAESGAVDCDKDSGITIPIREPRTESPDNDSAFSDTVSLLSSESSASSGVSTGHLKNVPNLNQCDSAKAAKIHLALQKLEQASVRRLFVKAFSADGASKSLLVDERMTCGHVTRLLADKNHVQMEPHWSLVEHLTDLQMERLYEDHELLVDSLMLWSRDSKNRVLFLQRPDKISLFNYPERFINTGTQMAPGCDHDEHTRSMLLEEFFNSGRGQVSFEGPLYLKTDSRKGWKRYHFVLRASGLYYFPKEKTKSTQDLVCLSSFVGYEVYRGLGWKKKHKAPTDFTFALRTPNLPTTSKTARFIKMLCAEDAETLEKWITLIRIVKYGKKLYDNHRNLLDDLARDEIDKLSSARSGSMGSIVSSVPSQISTGSSNSTGSNMSSHQNGRLSRASSSSSSGCLSDDNNGFDSEFTTGTIKRKPSMKPNLPLTSMTRQLKEVGEITLGSESSSNPTSPERGGTLTRRHSRRRSEESNSSSGTLKRRQSSRGSIESMNSSPLSITPTPSNPGTPIGTTRSIFNSPSPNGNTTPTNTLNKNVTSPLESMPSCMTDSLFSLPPPPDDLGTSLSGSMMSLDSLPPPPLPSELMNDFSGSQISLASLPPPPPDVKPVMPLTIQEDNENINNTVVNPLLPPIKQPPMSPILNHQPIYSPKVNSIKTSSLKSPPYKNPPPYNGNDVHINGTHSLPPPPPSSVTKSVKFADSPVLLRRKVCFEDEVNPVAQSIRVRETVGGCAPQPPPRAEATRLTTSPKRLSDSASNPPRDFLKDLQRVMRKKWQVAQKCKLEPATTPHEVLGFRDFNELTQATSALSNYYSESANVSNWVQEHYGANSLYENLGNNNNNNNIITIGQQNSGSGKKRPPPPPPKRSESTQLTTRSQI